MVRGNEAVTGGERVKGTEYVEIKGTPEAVANAVAEVNRILEEKAAMRGGGGGGGGYGHGGFEGHGHMDQNSYRAPPPGGYHDPYAAYGVPPPGAYAAHGAMPHGVRWVRDAAAHAHGDARRGWRLGPRSVRGC